MFFDTKGLSFCRVLEEHASEIEEELSRVPPEFFRPWLEEQLHSGGWLILPLFLVGPHEELERQSARNRLVCSRTTALLSGIPGMVGAGFSRMLPGTHIYPHRGLERGVYRCHLPLTISPGCALKFAGEERTWKGGECLVFEDTEVHECWNKGTSERTVLMADFEKAKHPVQG